MRLLIARHGQSVGNATKMIQGNTHGRLTKKGRKQAEKLVQRLLKEKIDIIYCSDLRRCKQTIKPFLKLRKISVVYTKELRERSFGIFNNKSRKEFLQWLKKHTNNKKNFSIRIPKGESFKDVRKRTEKFLNKLLKKNHLNVLLVTHGMTNVAIMLYLLKKNEKYYNKYKIDNAGLSIVHLKKNGEHRARLINSIKHLIN